MLKKALSVIAISSIVLGSACATTAHAQVRYQFTDQKECVLNTTSSNGVQTWNLSDIAKIDHINANNQLVVFSASSYQWLQIPTNNDNEANIIARQIRKCSRYFR